MSEPTIITIDEATQLAHAALNTAGASDGQAAPTARALVAAERDGQKGHGLSRVASYSAQLRAGKVVGDAVLSVERLSDAAVIVDAAHGFAYPAMDLAIDEVSALAKDAIISTASIRRSHHFGQAGAHVERLAEKGLVAFLFGNSPSAMAFWGGAKPMMGTNPIAFAAPMADGPPLVIDLALSVAARGKIMAASKTGDPIPADWAFDAAGQPTMDAKAALAGSMAPLGGAKGAALALMVEVLAAALTGSNFGFEASSFLNDQGPPPDVGSVLIGIDANALSRGAYFDRIAVLAAAIDDEPGARFPGSRRLQSRQQADEIGLNVAAPIYEELISLASAS